MPLEIRYYEPPGGGEAPFAKWFRKLDSQTSARIVKMLNRLAAGHDSNVDSLGGGVFELRIDFGPGHRVYFGREDGRVVVLLAAGNKKRQQDDIDVAHERWKTHLAAKARGRDRR